MKFVHCRGKTYPHNINAKVNYGPYLISSTNSENLNTLKIRLKSLIYTPQYSLVNIKLHKYFIIRVLYGVEEFQNS
jgi:hypothetical protein